MAYESLYRRYRPQRFAEVRGQDHVVTALHNAVRDDRVGHAYLLSGPRGTGKTTTARILAKALNCTALQDGEPCGECDSCKAIEAGTSYDLLELDAASNNGVDAMRDLIAKAALGSPGRTKVYLLDEVHMLSAGASNALLKTLEEPPGHVVFVLATTDPHKVLPTIRSRTQHFELHLLPAGELRSLVDDVVADAGLELDADAIDYALRAGGGSARDTLSALDQVVAAGGVLDRGDQVDALLDAIAAHDAGAALGEVADAVQRGHDPRVVGEALLARIRDVFLLRMGASLDHTAARDRSQLERWAESLDDRSCTRALEAIGDALREMRAAPDTRIPLEVALVRLTKTGSDTSVEALMARIERLERGLAVGAAPAGATSETPGAGAPPSPDTSRPGAVTPGPSTPAPPADPPQRREGSRPADAARAALADRSRPATDRPRTTTTSQATAAPTAAAPPPTPPSAGPAVRPEVASTPSPTPPAAITSEPPEATATNPPTSDPPGALSTSALETIWTERVLPSLSGLTKAMYSVGHFVDVSGQQATFAVPNDVHRQKSAQKLPEVEAAIAAQLGQNVTVELVIEGQTRARATDPDTGSTTPPPSVTPDTMGKDEGNRPSDAREPIDEIDEIGPLDELEDAPNDDRSVTQRIVDTFPGAEVIEG